MATLASDTVSHLMNSIFAINQNRLRLRGGYANILGIHMEGRYLNPDMKGAHMLELLAPPVLNELNTLALAMMPPPIHFSMAPELPGAKEFLELSKELNVTVGIAHTNATYEQALEAIENGARSFTHTFNAMTKVHHRNPGAAICALNCNDAYAEIICDGEHVHPAMVRLAYKSKPKDKLVLITDSMCATCAADGYYKIAGTDVYVQNGRAVDVNGTLAGSTLTMFKAMKNMMAFCNISLNEAIKYATINPAKMVKADFVGKIAKCYRADFIAISDITNPEIENVYIGGCEVK
jgi:N-acetylglucosamine-6-phosphate deacetylase